MKITGSSGPRHVLGYQYASHEEESRYLCDLERLGI